MLQVQSTYTAKITLTRTSAVTVYCLSSRVLLEIPATQNIKQLLIGLVLLCTKAKQSYMAGGLIFQAQLVDFTVSDFLNIPGQTVMLSCVYYALTACVL